jgi:arginine-tRNA-protein transferase
MGKTSDIDYFVTGSCDGAAYERALADGWRRAGHLFYRNACEGGCADCVPIRLDAARAADNADKTRRRTIRRNADLTLSVERATFSAEDYALFSRYLRSRHPEDAADFTEGSYVNAYVKSPVDTVIVRYRDPAGKLVAISFLDALADGLSSVYFAFEPDEARRSLGTFSVYAESEWLVALGMKWYYLGFWIAGCPKMSYKAGYRPHQLAKDGIWRDA